MKLELTVLVLLVGCSTPDPTPMLAEAPDVDIVSVVPAVESPDEALRDTIAVDAPASPEPSDARPLDPAIDVTIAKVAIPRPACPSPAYTCAWGYKPIGGMKFDGAKQCYARLPVGCMPEGSAINTDAFCSVRDDGAIFVGSSSQLEYLGSGWGARECTPEERGEAGTERRMCGEP